MPRTRVLIAGLCTVAALGACGSGGSTTSGTTSPTSPTTRGGASSTPTTDPNYHPTIDPSQFDSNLTNPYFPFKVGMTFILDGTRDGAPTHHETVVTTDTKVILDVTCVVVRDTVTSNGALVEQTSDWYAQASNGDVWYFGEATAEYENGNVSSTHGSWEAGVDGAQPGIVMKGDPKVGDKYRQEYRPGEAEDMAEVLRIDPSETVPAGTFQNIVVTKDTDPLNPDKTDEKHYAPGAGLIYSKRISTSHTEESSLVEMRTS